MAHTVSSVRAEQFLNAPLPIYVMPSGRVTFSRAEQSVKLKPISCVTPSGRVTSVREVQP